MYILNKKTKVVQECRNKDIIKICKKDTDMYQVAATREELKVPEDSGKAPGEAGEEDINISSINVTELRKLAKEKGLSGYSSLSKSELEAVLKDVIR